MLLEPKTHPLLVEVLSRPFDDAPRLALAEMLKAASDPRGELIVAQCRLASSGLSPSTRSELKDRSSALLTQHGASWMARAQGLQRSVMRRGFLDEIESPSRALIAKAKDLFAYEPITHLTMTEASTEDLSELAPLSAFARVTHLTIRGVLGDSGAKVLAEALAKRSLPLAALNLGSTSIETEGALALAAGLPGCGSLVLTGNAIGDEGLIALGKSKRLAKIATLFVTDNDLTDEGVEEFAKSTAMTSLSRLGIARNDDVSSEGLRAIAKSKKLKRLRWLEYTDPEECYQKIVTRGL